MLVDTHTHLYLEQFEEDRSEMVLRSIKNGVDKLFLPNIDSKSIASMMELEKDFPENCFALMGLHPTSVKENFQEELHIVQSWLKKRKFAAVGEIGIDLYWDKSFYKQQEAAFIFQVNLALEHDLPIVIHSRESIDLIIDLLEKNHFSGLRGVFHCFTGNADQAKRILELGFFMGIGGVLTFKNSGLDKVMLDIPMDFVVLETDAPFLAPTPHRGKRNESAYIRIVAARLAEIRGLSFGEIAEITSRNAKKLFGESYF